MAHLSCRNTTGNGRRRERAKRRARMLAFCSGRTHLKDGIDAATAPELMKAGVAMIRVVLLALGATASAGAALFAQEASEPAPAMAAAANSFTLDPRSAQTSEGRVAFNSGERLNWNFVPRENARALSIKQMSSERAAGGVRALEVEPVSRRASRRPTRSCTSRKCCSPSRAAGFATRALLHHRLRRALESGAWGWRYEGHHVSLNWTVVDGRLVASTPAVPGSESGRRP